MNETRERVASLLSAMNEGIYEKEHVMALSLLAAVSGESIFLLGPPGVAKSLVARRLKLAFREGRSFEYLMSRFSTPDEIFGPVSISKLKDHDRYERITRGYLPDATVVFLDEIWKAGPSIQNALLTVINEKLFRNGDTEMHLPLKALIAASNELPAKGEGLEALWDRFLLRCFVGCVQSQDAFDSMLLSDSPEEVVVDSALQIGDEEYAQWQEAAARVGVNDCALEVVHRVKDAIEEYNRRDWKDMAPTPIYVSDRRWKKVVRLLRSSAFLCGSQEVKVTDLLLLADCLWDEMSQRQSVSDMVNEALKGAVLDAIGIEQLRHKLTTLRDDLKSDNGLRELTDEGVKVVNTFYYQVVGVHTRERVLVYASEYQSLRTGVESFFYMSRPKSMPQTIVIRKYERTKAPNVSPRDIIKVSKELRAIVIGGNKYDLLLNDAADLFAVPQERPANNGFDEKLQAMQDALSEVLARLAKMESDEIDYARHHLFVESDASRVVKDIFEAARHEMAQIANEIEETKHSIDVENRTY